MGTVSPRTTVPVVAALAGSMAVYSTMATIKFAGFLTVYLAVAIGLVVAGIIRLRLRPVR